MQKKHKSHGNCQYKHNHNTKVAKMLWTHNTRGQDWKRCCAMKHHTQQNNTKLMPMTTIHEQEPHHLFQCAKKQCKKNKFEALQSSQQSNDNKTFPNHHKEVTTKTMHTQQQCAMMQQKINVTQRHNQNR